MNIRHAGLNDIPRLLPLLAELGYPCGLEDLTVRFKQFLQNPDYGVAVCDLNGEIAGLVAWSKSELFVSNTSKFRIEALVVMLKARGKGIGKKLMAFVEGTAKQHMPAIVKLTSGLRRAKDGSHEFYKSLGYKNEGPMAKLYLRKEL
jgi:GNAT superfamily N-acetyltransferase